MLGRRVVKVQACFAETHVGALSNLSSHPALSSASVANPLAAIGLRFLAVLELNSNCLIQSRSQGDVSAMRVLAVIGITLLPAAPGCKRVHSSSTAIFTTSLAWYTLVSDVRFSKRAFISKQLIA